MSEPSAAAGLGDQDVADFSCDPGAHQAVADHKEGGDQDDVSVGKSREGLVHRHDPGEGEHHDHDEGDRVHARLVQPEHDDG
jgi:hypothetical protein